MRFDINLKSKYQVIAAYSGFIFILAGIISLFPIIVTLFRPEELVYAKDFLVSSLISIGFGSTLWVIFRKRQSVDITVMEGGIVVLFSWIVTCIISSLPFVFILHLNFTQAIFESVSGWTTTGLSVLNVSETPHCILLWRSIMQLAGGAGLVIIMLSTIAGPAGPGLSAAEGRGTQLVPNVRRSARLVANIYIAYAVVGVVAYILSGMSIFDAINHSFTAISTGGFSTRVESIGYWNSSKIECISIFLMFFGNLNFLTAYLLFTGKFRAVSRNGEIRLFAFLLAVSSLILLLLVTLPLYQNLEKGLRVAVFESISALTTTGFSTVSYNDWNSTGFLFLIVLMLIGGGAFSTAGGIKQYRIYLLLKSIQWRFQRAFLPKTAITDNSVWFGDTEETINDNHISQISSFVFLYLIVYIVGVVILTAHGYSLRDSLFEFASALGTVGLSIGITQASSPPSILWSEIIAMFLGRLEFFIIIISILKIVRDFTAFIRKK
jgi:trk system potassium uptake protein TrkH